jgi:hypothetical protein
MIVRMTITHQYLPKIRRYSLISTLFPSELWRVDGCQASGYEPSERTDTANAAS